MIDPSNIAQILQYGVFTALIIAMVILPLYLIYKFTLGRNKDWIYKIKYSRKPIPETVIEDCLEAIDRGLTHEQFIKEQLTTGKYNVKAMDELRYIYKLVYMSDVEGDNKDGK